MKIIYSHYGIKDGADANGFTRGFNLAKGLVKIGNDVYFLTTQKKGFQFPYNIEYRDGVKIISFAEIFPLAFRKGGIAPLSIILKVLYCIFKKADIVHSDSGHRPSSGWPCYVHRFFHKSTYCSEWWEHFGKGGIYDEMPNWYQKTMGLWDNLFETKNRLNADACVPISHKLKERAISIGIPSDAILVLNGGADTSTIPFVKSEKHKVDFGFDSEVFIIGLIGINDVEFENNKLLFDSVKKLHNKGFKIHIIATGKLHPDIIRKNNLNNILTLFNWLPYKEFTKLITIADLFSLLQINNLRNQSRFPNKLGDYLAAGRPIIMNPIGDLELYVTENPNSFYVVNNNFDNICDQLEIAYKRWKNQEVNYNQIYNIALSHSWDNRAKTLNDFYLKA